MGLKHLVWNGNLYTLQIRRHWNTFFGLATVFEIKNPNMEKLLPAGAGYHIMGIYELCEAAKGYFDTFDNWWSFSCRLCDQYCDYYVVKRATEGNTFNAYSEEYAVQNFAKASRGYVGPHERKLT